MPATGAKKDGPYGGPQGTPFDIDYTNHPPKRLETIQIWSMSDHISAISFTYIDENDQAINKGPFGPTDRADLAVINIGSGESVKELAGSYDASRVTSLRVVTTLTSYGPYGKQEGTSFSSNKGKIIAFFGRNSSNGINAIGTYYIPA